VTNSATNYLRVIQGGKAKISAGPQPITPKIVFEQCRTLNLYGKQCYVVFHLDKNNRIMSRDTILAPLSVKEVFRSACLSGCHAIIVTRTSDFRRSEPEDVVNIAPLVNWGRALEIPLLDYVTTDCDGFTSYQERYSGFFQLNRAAAPVIPEPRKPTPEQQRLIDTGKRIRTLRIEAGIFKQKDLAEKTGIRPSYISSLEKGYRLPNKDEAEKISAILGIQPQNLVDSPAAKDVTPPEKNEVEP